MPRRRTRRYAAVRGSGSSGYRSRCSHAASHGVGDACARRCCAMLLLPEPWPGLERESDPWARAPRWTPGGTYGHPAATPRPAPSPCPDPPAARRGPRDGLAPGGPGGPPTRSTAPIMSYCCKRTPPCRCPPRRAGPSRAEPGQSIAVVGRGGAGRAGLEERSRSRSWPKPGAGAAKGLGST